MVQLHEQNINQLLRKMKFSSKRLEEETILMSEVTQKQREKHPVPSLYLEPNIKSLAQCVKLEHL